MKVKLTDTQLDQGCMASYRRYRALSPREAELAYAYDVMGFAKCMVEDGGMNLKIVRQMTNDLFDLLEKANP